MKISKKFFIWGSLMITIVLIIGCYQHVTIWDDNLDRILFRITKLNTSHALPWIYRSDCQILTIDELKNYSSNNQFPNGISKLLHYVSNEEDISKTCTSMYKNCGLLNKDVRIIHWTDASFYRVLMTQFPYEIISQWQSVFANLDDPLRTSMIRVMVLYLFGGVSLSLDTVCTKPFKDVFSDESCFISLGHPMKANIEFNRDVDIGESVIACQQEHRFLSHLIKNKDKRQHSRFYVTENYLQYNSTKQKMKVEELSESKAYQVLPKLEMEKICSKNHTEEKIVNGCKLLKSYKPVNASKVMLVHQPIYGESKTFLVASDICQIGVPIHVVIL